MAYQYISNTPNANRCDRKFATNTLTESHKGPREIGIKRRHFLMLTDECEAQVVYIPNTDLSVFFKCQKLFVNNCGVQSTLCISLSSVY